MTLTIQMRVRAAVSALERFSSQIKTVHTTNYQRGEKQTLLLAHHISKK
jgi:hypothetical protein